MPKIKITSTILSGCFLMTLGVLAQSASALTGSAISKRPVMFRLLGPQDMATGTRLNISPLLQDEQETDLVTRMMLRGQISIDRAIMLKISDVLGAIPLGLNRKDDSPGTYNYSFTAGNVPLCNHQVRAHQFENGQVIALGSIPNVYNGAMTATIDWPDLDRTKETVISALESEIGVEVVGESVYSARCYIVSDGSLVPVWRIGFMTTHGPFLGVSGETFIHSLDPSFFDVDGHANVYPFNVVKTPNRQDFVIENLVGDGTLTSDILKTNGTASYPRANRPDHNFNYDVSAPEFGEVSSFVNATKQLKFLMSLGFEWYGLKPLILTVRAPGLDNNARFVPQYMDGLAGQIDVGQGDGINLRNLELDSDVVSHEVGHFVVYRSVTKTTGESLVLHEGLADYFAYARSGDACLGESICPLGGHACIKPGVCLRTAENNYKVDDQDWKAWGGTRGILNHLHSQVISGLLWDLRDKKIPSGAQDRLVMTAIKYLPEDADFADFLLALLTSDSDLYKGQYRLDIQNSAKARNMGNRLPNIADSGAITKSSAQASPDSGIAGKEQAAGTSNPAQNTGASDGTTSSRSGGSGVGCGTVGIVNNSSRSPASLIILLATPLIIFVVRRRPWV